MAKKPKLPPYFLWREGRPRWAPGPALRAKGHKGRDLKDTTGAWLSFGEAVDAAMAINIGIAANQPLPAELPAQHSISALVAAYSARPKMRPAKAAGEDSAKVAAARDKLRLADSTRQNYACHLRLIEAAYGDLPAAAITPAGLEEFYEVLIEERGLSMANACMVVFKIIFNFAIDSLRWSEIGSNPVRGVKLAPVDGRLVCFTPEEFSAMVQAADYAGMAGMGDAITLAALTGQRKGDLLTLQEGDLRGDIYIITPRKTARSTGRRAYVPVTLPLKARVEAMRARKRQAQDGGQGQVIYRTELVCSETRRPYHDGSKQFDKEFRTVRALASGFLFALEEILFAMAGKAPPERNAPFTPQPGVIDKHFSDLRDTAVTWLFIAHCDEAEIANIQGRSLTSVKAVLDKHYFVRGSEMSESARAKFETFLLERNIGG